MKKVPECSRGANALVDSLRAEGLGESVPGKAPLCGPGGGEESLQGRPPKSGPEGARGSRHGLVASAAVFGRRRHARALWSREVEMDVDGTVARFHLNASSRNCSAESFKELQ